MGLVDGSNIVSESPQVFKGGRRIDNGRPFDSVDNTRWNTYYIPEITSVIERYIKLKSDPAALESFVTAQKALTSQLMKVCTSFTKALCKPVAGTIITGCHHSVKLGGSQ